MEAEKKRGFTLIELLVIVSIIGILAVISMSYMQGPKEKAKDVSFQSSAKSIQDAAGVCCGGNNVGNLQNVVGQDLCSPDTNSVYPGSDSIGSIEIVRDCNALEGFSIKLTPGTKNNSGKISYALCDRDGCDFVNP